MRIAESSAVLTGLLADAGIRPGPVRSDQLPGLLEVLRRFAEVSCEDAAAPEEDGDGLLAQYGTSTWRRRQVFTTDLTRQFLEDDDEDPPMWQLSCAVRWAPTAETETLGSGHHWSFGIPMDTFFAEVVRLPGWAWALSPERGAGELAVSFEQV